MIVPEVDGKSERYKGVRTMWGLDKASKTPMQVDSELKETYELARKLRKELERIRDLTEETLIKAQISHSLLVVRKIDETKLEELSALLD